MSELVQTCLWVNWMSMVESDFKPWRTSRMEVPQIAVRGDLRPTAGYIYDIGTSSLRYDDVFATSGTVNASDLRDDSGVSRLLMD